MFSKILIANRGEIACRIINTARRLGIRTVAVFSDVDVLALHVRQADEAVCIGAAPAAESYLCAQKIIQAAIATGAQAIHPGYGFLSEDASFAKQCEKRGICFIGPPVKAIEAMGSKSAAKIIVERAGVPLLPGYHGKVQSPAALLKQAAKIGFPLLIKAVAGGGGKGMRLVTAAPDFKAALLSAQREAQASFGDCRVLLERYLPQVRHVEVQIFCDSFGSGVYLFDRDCSIQRRHQKVIEEAPAPGLSKAQRQAMGEAALQVAHAVDYQGAGTVEFLLEPGGEFFFMEMNTRLQVEHPVTEMISSEDLVEWQLRVADGEALPKTQQELRSRGHAMEARIYAEDPRHDFLPSSGVLERLQSPVQSEWLRIDSGVVEGDRITSYYDPMIAKLIVWGESRQIARLRLLEALSHYNVGGIVTNTEFLYNLIALPAFARPELETAFIARHSEALLRPAADVLQHSLLLLTLYLALPAHAKGAVGPFGQQQTAKYISDTYSPWYAQDGWRLHQAAKRQFRLCHDTECYQTTLWQTKAGTVSAAALNTYKVGLSRDQDATGYQEYEFNGGRAGDKVYAELDGQLLQGRVVQREHGYCLFIADRAMEFTKVDEGYADSAGQSADIDVRAPMNGSITAVLVTKGDCVSVGQSVAVMEAMKMEYNLSAQVAGQVAQVFCRVGDSVSGGACLIEIEARSS